MGGIDERVDPAIRELAHEPLDRQTSAVGLVTWLTTSEPRPRRHGAEQRLDHLVLARDRERDRRERRPRPRRAGRRPHRVDHGVVLVVVGQQLVAWLEAQAPSTVFTPVVAFGTKARPSGSAWRNAPTASRASLEMTVELARQEPDRLGLESVAPGALDLEDVDRARPVRAVVEERHRRVGAASRGRRASSGPMSGGSRWSGGVTSFGGRPSAPGPVSDARSAPRLDRGSADAPDALRRRRRMARGTRRRGSG